MKIEIENLTFKCIIGILDFERKEKQKVIINLSFDYIYSNNNFINYSEISDLIIKEMKEKKFGLLEDALIYLETLLYRLYKISNLKIKITKPNILKNCQVSLSN